MPYAHWDIQDADSHLLEPPDFYAQFTENALRQAVPQYYTPDSGFTETEVRQAMSRHAEPEFRAAGAAELMTRKLWDALGAFDGADRGAALDLLGFRRQIVFDSLMRIQLRELEQQEDMDVLYGLARAHVRAMAAFCAADPRLIAPGYVPLADPVRSVEAMQFAIESGCQAVAMAVDCPRRHSPSHADLDRVWAMAAESGIPVLYHLGGGRLPSPAFAETGRRRDKGYAGGDGTFNSLQFLGAPLPLIETLNALVLDGVLERHPKLKVGILEFGADWLPGWMRFLDSTMSAYRRAEERLQALSLKPSEYIRRQVRVSPFCFEHTGWIIEQGGADVLMFSSDYPHIEGGRDPIGKFEASLEAHGVSAEDRQKFYSGNFDDLMGASSEKVSTAPR